MKAIATCHTHQFSTISPVSCVILPQLGQNILLGPVSWVELLHCPAGVVGGFYLCCDWWRITNLGSEVWSMYSCAWAVHAHCSPATPRTWAGCRTQRRWRWGSGSTALARSWKTRVWDIWLCSEVCCQPKRTVQPFPLVDNVNLKKKMIIKLLQKTFFSFS